MMWVLVHFLYFLSWLTVPTVYHLQEGGVSFAIKHGIGTTARGTFKGLQGTINWPEGNLTQVNIKATVKTATINTGLGLRDKALQKEDYFDVAKYPEIVMQASGIQSLGQDKYRAVFNIKIKQAERKQTIDFVATKTANTIQFKASFKLNRLDYGVGSSSLLLADSALVSLNVIANQ